MTENLQYSVYGSWGFIGSQLCDFGKSDKYMRHEPDHHNFRDKFPADYPDIVYFISTIHNYNPTQNNPYVDISTNLTHLMTVLQANRVKYGNDFTFNYISTWFVYGQVELPAKEDACCSPKGFYSITKKAAEDLLVSYCETFGIKYRIFRLPNVLGIGDVKLSPKRNAMQYMIKTLAEGGMVDLYDEDCQRDYLHVSDVCSAIDTLVEKGNYGEIYNIGSGTPHSIHQTVKKAQELANYEGMVNLVPVPEFHKKVQVKDMWMDTTKLTSLGWKPERSLDSIVEELVTHYKEMNG